MRTKASWYWRAVVLQTPANRRQAGDDVPASCLKDGGLHCNKAPLGLLGGTEMSEVISLALDKIGKRKRMYKENGIDTIRPPAVSDNRWRAYRTSVSRGSI